LTNLSPLGDIKIVDFGLARRLGSAGELREILGTPEYVGKVYSVSFIFKSTHISLFMVSLLQKSSSSLKVMYMVVLLLIIHAAPEILNYEPITTATDLW